MGALPSLMMLDEVGSTNDEALALGRAGAPHGAAVAARSQTAGRGRRGHAWASPPGNLYLSVVLRPRLAPTRLAGLAGACGLGVLRIADEALLKWPNDVYARGRKLAGVLVEAARDDAGELFAVCGVGVNVARAPRGLDAISLAELGGAPPLPSLAEALREGVVSLDGIRDAYLARLAWLGETVRVLAAEDGAELARGAFETVDAWGRAVVGRVPDPKELASQRPHR